MTSLDSTQSQVSLCPSGGSVFEEGGEGLERSARGADHACERAGEQALSGKKATKSRNHARRVEQKLQRENFC